MTIEQLILPVILVCLIAGTVGALAHKSIAIGLCSLGLGLLFFARSGLRDLLEQSNVWASVWLSVSVTVVSLILVRHRRLKVFSFLLVGACLIALVELFIYGSTKPVKLAAISWLLIAFLLTEGIDMYKGLPASLALQRMLATYQSSEKRPKEIVRLVTEVREAQGDQGDFYGKSAFVLVMLGALLTL